jgi:NAD(P)H-hydrate epimerase
LLELAGNRLGHAIGRYFSHPGMVVGYLGKGHNAGDALVALKVLRDEYGWRIATRNAFELAECAPLTQEKWCELGLPSPLDGEPAWQTSPRPLVLLDGLLGVGGSGNLREPLARMAAEMHHLRQHAGALVAAVDLPSGVDPDSGRSGSGAVVADVTFMIGNAKCGLLRSEAVNLVGSLVLVPVEVLTAARGGELELIAPQEMEFGKQPRPYEFHKGLAGRVAVVAGSVRYPGAAVLAATGALRAGAGLITLHAPAGCASMIAAKCPPEIIVRGYESFQEIPTSGADALVVGCGLGELIGPASDDFLTWLAACEMPAVIDADALNHISRTSRSDLFKEHHVLTPHPGEFQRLAPDLAGLAREEAARAFADRHPATLLLKGARSLVTRRGHPLWCNATGSPGMATGGQGDLLAGVIGALLASGLPPMESAALAAWLCGRAAEIAMLNMATSPESLTPSDTVLPLGAAFRDWQTSSR